MIFNLDHTRALAARARFACERNGRTAAEGRGARSGSFALFSRHLVTSLSIFGLVGTNVAFSGCQGGGLGSGADATSTGTTSAGTGGTATGGATGGGGNTTGGDVPSASTPTGNGGVVTGTGSAGGTGGGSGSGGVGGGDGTTAGVSLDPGFGATTTRARADFSGTALSSGIATVPVTLQNTTSFQVVLEAGTGTINTALEDPLGRLVVSYDGSRATRQQTYAVLANSLVNALPYQTSELDPAVTAGTYLEGVNFSTPATAFAGTAIAKNDPDLTTGTLRVNIFLVNALSQTTETLAAVNDAVTQWKTIYGTAGITLDVQIMAVDGPTALPNPTVGDALFLTQSGAVRGDSLNLFMGQTISGTDSDAAGEVIGVSAAIPGPDAPTLKSAVVVSLTGHQDGAGMFDTALMAETMAHESGHYLGLFHPVEISSGNSEATFQFIEGDLLADTATCDTVDACKASGVATNVMFPTALAGVTQRTLSPQQIQVLNLQVMVD